MGEMCGVAVRLPYPWAEKPSGQQCSEGHPDSHQAQQELGCDCQKWGDAVGEQKAAFPVLPLVAKWDGPPLQISSNLRALDSFVLCS